jgi:hypothetical protein
LKQVVFAETETAADRIAPTETLKLVVPWNAVYLRLPVEARGKHHPDAGGSYAYDHETDDRWTLWVNYDVFDFGSEPVDLHELVGEIFADPENSPFPDREVIDRWVDPSPDPTQEAMATVTYKDVQDGELLHHTLWHRVVRQGGQYVMGHFTWVVVDARRDEPDMQALTRLIEREVRNALLFYGGPKKGPPAGNA